jgi:hypothetical protein
VFGDTDPDPQDLHVFGPPGSISQRYGSGSFPFLIDVLSGLKKCLQNRILKVPKCEIFDRSDFYYFYTIKPFWVDDFVVKILTYYFKFWGSQASFTF